MTFGFLSLWIGAHGGLFLLVLGRAVFARLVGG